MSGHAVLRPAGRAALGRAWQAIDRFAFAPASAVPLAALRIGLASVLLLQAAMVAPVFLDLYGRSGFLQGPLNDMMARSHLLRVGWLIDALAPLGIGEAALIRGTGALYALALVALLLGWRARAAAALAWLTHLLLMMTADSTSYGADSYAHIFLFYLLWMPSGAALSLDRWLGRAPGDPPATTRLSLRVVQVHLCISYLASGLHKASGEQWWSGEAVWRSVMLPEYRQIDLSWLAHHPWIPMVAGWLVILVEAGYALFIWPRRSRRLWVAATVALHVGIAIFMGLVVFGALMAVLTLAAFGVSAEPRGSIAERSVPRMSLT
ncbi:HTTM domain-containing protein [Sorangium cellulosum]|uniref:HTTM domain-containing protein n=1 Tax=Sorangium cellulosum TaxID=56 RepID=UPI000B093682|nr:HTTM domain-containing protein [Sorangium cellulosum]